VTAPGQRLTNLDIFDYLALKIVFTIIILTIRLTTTRCTQRKKQTLFTKYQFFNKNLFVKENIVRHTTSPRIEIYITLLFIVIIIYIYFLRNSQNAMWNAKNAIRNWNI